MHQIGCLLYVVVTVPTRPFEYILEMQKDIFLKTTLVGHHCKTIVMSFVSPVGKMAMQLVAAQMMSMVWNGPTTSQQLMKMSTVSNGVCYIKETVFECTLQFILVSRLA